MTEKLLLIVFSLGLSFGGSLLHGGLGRLLGLLGLAAAALSSSGRTPVPVPMSQTRSPRLTAAKSASSTASVPKRKPSSRWMMRRPSRCKSSMRSPAFNSVSTSSLPSARRKSDFAPLKLPRSV